MPEKLRVYLDTSVFSAYYDDRTSERRAQTMEFWRRREEFELATSDLALEELVNTPDPAHRIRLEKLAEACAVLPVTSQTYELVRRYLEADIFGKALYNDAVHVAVAVLNRQDVLLSWNFRHLVNRRRRTQVNELNISLGLPTIEILAPPEV